MRWIRGLPTEFKVGAGLVVGGFAGANVAVWLMDWRAGLCCTSAMACFFGGYILERKLPEQPNDE